MNNANTINNANAINIANAMNNDSSINLDINNYSIDELEKLLKLQANYSTENVIKQKEAITSIIKESALADAQKTELYIFLDNIRNKLINNLEKIDEKKYNLVNQYDGNHFIIKTKNNDFKTLLENNKQIDKSIIKRTYTIDSLFRQNYDLPDNASHNYVIQLPETINRAITMSISSLEIPLTYYNISTFNNNNAFTIQELSGTNVSGELYNIRLTSGLYQARFNVANLNTKIIAYNIVDEINNVLSKCPNSDICANLRFGLDDRTGQSYFRLTPQTPIKRYRINFDIDNSNNTNNSNIKYNCIENYLHQKLGWQLGFTSKTIDVVSTVIGDSSEIYSDKICQLNYPRYIYIAIDDFQASSRNYFSVAAQSLIAPNIIGRINILSLLEEKTAFRQAASAGDFLYTQKHIREYFGPTDITKLRIQLLDEYGGPFNINNADWSFVVTFECFYN
jgi:hypothetical protein